MQFKKNQQDLFYEEILNFLKTANYVIENHILVKYLSLYSHRIGVTGSLSPYSSENQIFRLIT